MDVVNLPVAAPRAGSPAQTGQRCTPGSCPAAGRHSPDGIADATQTGSNDEKHQTACDSEQKDRFHLGIVI